MGIGVALSLVGGFKREVQHFSVLRRNCMTRTYSQLSAEERGMIMAMKMEGRSARAIALSLERSPSTVTRV